MEGKQNIVIPKTKLGSQGLEVSLQGLGCMGMSAGYGAPQPEPDMIALIRHAVDLGITFFDTADAYGPHSNEILLGKAVKGIQHKVELATKFGHYFVDGEMMVRGDPAYVRAACEASLRRLDVDCIDLYYQHRVDPNVPIEVTVGEMKKLVEEGKVKYLGLSEVSASTIRRAHAVHPITAVQLEWSLWCREVEGDVIPTCRELGIGIVVYSPLGHGFFSAGAKVMEGTTEKDFRRFAIPRLMGDNLENNQRLFNELQRLAVKKGCTPGQLALAWVQNHGGDVVPIPGTTKLKNLEENVGALKVHLTKEESEEIEALFHGDAVSGVRRSERFAKWNFDKSDTPPLTSYNHS